MQQTHLTQTLSEASQASLESVYTSGEAYFEALVQDIEKAQHSIDFEVYRFKQDSLGQQVAQALGEAALRGVQVRLLVDGVGTPFWAGSFVNQLENYLVETKIHHPVPFAPWQWSRSVNQLPWLDKLIYLIFNVNSRNHRKVVLIDECIAYVGSFNIDRCHLSHSRGGQNWRDTAVRIEKADLHELKLAFETSWHSHMVRQPLQELLAQVKNQTLFKLNHTRLRRRMHYRGLLRRIAKCQERVWITNAYFVPNQFLIRKLKDAAKRGVDVRILLPQKSDVSIIPWTSKTYYAQLLDAGVKIYEYLPSMLHAKTLILDHWVLVGSSNLNHRSLLHDLEADFMVTHPEAKTAIIEQFSVDLECADEVTSAQHIKRTWHQWLLGRLGSFFKVIL